MKPRTSLQCAAALIAACVAGVAHAQATPEPGPVIELPPAAPEPTAPPTSPEPVQPLPAAPSSPTQPPAVDSAPPAPEAPPASPELHLGTSPDDQAQEDAVLSRGLTPLRLQQSGTVIGGYGQFNLQSLKVGHEDFDTRANVRRVVLFLAHELSEDIHVYTELEWENALACSSCRGSAEVEQAFVQWRLHGDALALRAGLVLVPMGIVNQWHEPPVFNGVERPSTDQIIIPSTWRELGVGISGELDSALYRYELYLTTTLDPARLGATGIANARTLGSLAPADAFAVTGRFEVEPWLGVIAGASFFLSDAGGNADYWNAAGKKRDLSVPVLGYALDARARRDGFEGRILWTQFFLPESDDLLTALHEDGSPLFPAASTTGAIPTRTQGGYLELAYDVLHLLRTHHELLAFVRLETYDAQAAVPHGYQRRPELDVDELTTGLTYRPIAQLAFKGDVQLRDRRLGYDELGLNLGIGYMF